MAKATAEVRYAALTIGGDTKKYYRFQTPDDGVYDFYDEDGVSDKKFLVRKPVATGIETSPFGWRTHPLLHISEMHTGVDWGAPSARRSLPPATARSRRSASKAAMANTCVSATPTVMRPPTAT